jgi:hypothetical protein
MHARTMNHSRPTPIFSSLPAQVQLLMRLIMLDRQLRKTMPSVLSGAEERHWDEMSLARRACEKHLLSWQGLETGLRLPGKI